MDKGATDRAKSILIEMLEGADESTQAIALNRLVDNNNILTQDKLISFLYNDGYLISNVALSIAEKRQDPELIPAIISNLSLPKTSLQARQSLKKFSTDLILESFQNLFSDADLNRKLRLGIIRTLREYPNDDSINILLTQLNREDQDVYNEVVDSLLAIARIHPIDEEKKEEIAQEIRAMAHKVYALNEAIHLTPEDENKFFLQDHLNNKIQNTLPTLLKLGVLHVPDTPIETYIHTVKSGDPAKLPFLLEFFENIFSKEEREIINPLIEPISLTERSEVGHSNFKDLPSSLDQELTDSAYSPNKWESVIALDYLLKSEKLDVMKKLDWENVPGSKANQELFARRIQKWYES
jgi:hypothetical protein